MIILSSDLINLPVYTQSGRYLGRVDSFEIDLDNNMILRYQVKTGLIKGLWHQQLIVDKSQVISIDKEKMVVEDNTVKEPMADLVASPATK